MSTPAKIDQEPFNSDSNGNRWVQLQSVYERIVAAPANQRDSLLDELCTADRALRAEVVSLLEHESRVDDDFLRPQELDAVSRLQRLEDRPDPLIGRQIDHYRIKSLIAHGGMGVVYLAEQDHPRRDVALKVLRSGTAASDALRRFQYESQTLASLQHPNIAQVYQAGSAVLEIADMGGDGTVGATAQPRLVPYFAMEYVPKATPITEYADLHKLDLPKRLLLFIHVCDAVQHGHQKGVIHRDLKPANILLTGEPPGTVKVIDFGIARSTNADVAVTTLHTQAGQLIGTLQYMSPEQCAGEPSDIDTRSDVYSLGVVLYELVCRRLPYDLTRSTIHTAVKTICESEPIRPRSIDRSLRGNLETILLKTLAKDRESRYGSPADLVRDVRHFLNREPIESRTRGAWYKAVHWVARHPIIFTMAFCLLLAITTFSATFTAVWWVSFRPYMVKYDQTQKIAVLCARNGNELKHWGGGTSAAVFTDLIECPDYPSGRRRLLWLGLHHSADHPLAGSLAAIDVDDDLDHPLWQARVETDDRPENLQKWGRGKIPFSVCFIKAQDVFPEVPGQEIVVGFVAQFSQRPFRIYSLDGHLLYQVWFDGGLDDAMWLPGAKLLVCTGHFDDIDWDSPRAVEVFGDKRDKPSVVFAICPSLGFIRTDYLSTKPGNLELQPKWLHWIKIPNRPMNKLDVVLQAAPVPYDSSKQVMLLVDSTNGSDPVKPHVSWILDENGDRVSGSIVVNDAYHRNRERLPDPNSIEFVPIPQDVPRFPGPKSDP